MDEDCLFLNIFTPFENVTDEKIPVVIFFHEYDIVHDQIGDIVSGFGQVIFVQVQYRMNVWGFTSTGDDILPGNAGLWDQHLAIHWVHENIWAFGGDPDLVTLFGYYEGASNVIYHAMYPGSIGLFRRIIVSCGGDRCPWAFNKGPLATTNMIGRALGCYSDSNSTSQLIECISAKTTDEIVTSIHDQIMCINFPYETITSTDGTFLTYPPHDLLSPYSEIGKEERNTLSNFEIMTSVYHSGGWTEEGWSLIKIPSCSVDNTILHGDSMIIVDDALENSTNDVMITYENQTVIIKTDIKQFKESLNLTDATENEADLNEVSEFTDSNMDVFRLMFGPQATKKSMKKIKRRFDDHCSTYGSTSLGCYTVSYSNGGPTWDQQPSCVIYPNGSLPNMEEYLKYYGEAHLPKAHVVRPMNQTGNIFVDDSVSGTSCWTVRTDLSEDYWKVEILKKAATVWTSFAKSGALSSVVALGANIICNKIPGLAPRQRAICRSRPVAIAVIGGGARLGLNECQYQFRNMRWNCTMASKYDSMFGYQHDIASREAAVWSAMSSSGVVYAITQACSLGTLNECGCDKSKTNFRRHPDSDFMWGGCSADIKYGLKLARKFLDAREIEETARSLMNRHNNKVGRKAVRDNMRLDCRCHGPTGSCSLKTCWRRLPSFRDVGDFLLKQYHRSKQVVPWRGSRLLRPNALVLKKSNRPNKKPRRRDLVFLQRSPNFCEYNLTTGSLGTVGRKCNKGSKGNDGCTLMCCGRGYNTHQYTRTWQCNCTFRWCCEVRCENCTEKRLEYTCK